MADHKEVTVIATKEDMFVVVDGVRIARRGYLGTPQGTQRRGAVIGNPALAHSAGVPGRDPSQFPTESGRP